MPLRSISCELKGRGKGSCRFQSQDSNAVNVEVGRKELRDKNNKDRDIDNWDAKDSAKHYRIDMWGAPYFAINLHGNICVRPYGTSDGSDEIDIMNLIDSLQSLDVKPPMVIRFPDILFHRMRRLQECFNKAISKYDYQQSFQGVFPIKCNHDPFLLDDIVEFGHQFKFGLEVGSKPELLIAISKICCNRDGLVICNGYKDRTYIETALLAMRLGIKVVLVLEQMEELNLVIKTSRALKVQPVIGVRAKLSTKHNGHWAGTSGDSGKFGLSINKLVQVVHRLRKENMLQCLQLLHFHIGSQIRSISTIKDAIDEGSQIYCELALMGAPMHYIDVGGGLGIDYDGTKSPSNVSINYSMQDYANYIIAALRDACFLKGISQPVIVSESGRALASHHSVIVFDVLSVSQRMQPKFISKQESSGTTIVQSIDKADYSGSIMHANINDQEDCNPGDDLLSSFHEVSRTMCQQNLLEAFNDAKQLKQKAETLFKLGFLSLEDRAQMETLYDAISYTFLDNYRDSDLPDELEKLKNSLAAIYHINLSIFRSVPDSWAISHVFPVMPLHRLHEKPTAQATLADLTCDSDGKIENFIGPSGEVENVLSVHHLREGEPYYMGLFLAGVYQEVMGSAHNLFGGINVIHVRLKALNNIGKANDSKSKGQYTFDRIVEGQTAEEILFSVQHNGSKMIEDLQREAEEAVRNGCLSMEEADILIENYKCSLNSYPYLTK
ncbi:hypothetical protein SUGI_0849780 [Cryptomeria japonica]|nr:hypothetical protein SUGI_0849780 [Cryptomeria japonica]